LWRNFLQKKWQINLVTLVRAFTSLVPDFRKQREEKQDNEHFFQVKKPGRNEMQEPPQKHPLSPSKLDSSVIVANNFRALDLSV